MCPSGCHMEEMVPRHKGHDTIMIGGSRYITARRLNLINRWSSTHFHPLGVNPGTCWMVVWFDLTQFGCDGKEVLALPVNEPWCCSHPAHSLISTLTQQSLTANRGYCPAWWKLMTLDHKKQYLPKCKPHCWLLERYSNSFRQKYWFK